ncbi:hypothetical protein [Kaistia hirudinis]|nr:hypothetical protein [Kaistia hirudinis]
MAVAMEFERWLVENFAFRYPKKSPRNLYDSNLIVDFDEDISRSLGILVSMGQAIGGALYQTYETYVPLGVHAIAFSADPEYVTTHGIQFKTDFSIVRRLGHPHSGNRYFCTAPLPNRTHFDLLINLENIALGRIA